MIILSQHHFCSSGMFPTLTGGCLVRCEVVGGSCCPSSQKRPPLISVRHPLVRDSVVPSCPCRRGSHIYPGRCSRDNLPGLSPGGAHPPFWVPVMGGSPPPLGPTPLAPRPSSAPVFSGGEPCSPFPRPLRRNLVSFTYVEASVFFGLCSCFGVTWEEKRASWCK